jgi:putative DNA primase/helicase
MSEIFDGDEKLVTYCQRLLGYGITGLSIYHVIPIFYGPEGRNGKSTMFEILKLVLGDIIYKTRSEMLLESRYQPARGAADADTLAFRGKRIIWASENDDGRSLNIAKVKELCGGDTLNARAPYGKRPVEFAPTHLLILLTNNRPAVPANDDAIWERIHLIPFNLRFIDNPRAPNERKADHDLLEKLKAEASGILAWLVRGCIQWKTEGLNPPDIVKVATSEYRAYEDDIGQFIKETCVLRDDASESMGCIYRKYENWHTISGLPGKPLSMKKLSPRLERMGFERDASGRNVIFKGICLREHDE